MCRNVRGRCRLGNGLFGLVQVQVQLQEAEDPTLARSPKRLHQRLQPGTTSSSFCAAGGCSSSSSSSIRAAAARAAGARAGAAPWVNIRRAGACLLPTTCWQACSSLQLLQCLCSKMPHSTTEDLKPCWPRIQRQEKYKETRLLCENL